MVDYANLASTVTPAYVLRTTVANCLGPAWEHAVTRQISTSGAISACRWAGHQNRWCSSGTTGCRSGCEELAAGEFADPRIWRKYH